MHHQQSLLLLIIILITLNAAVALVAEEFLSTSASQLTYHGLCELSASLKEEQLCVLFRNNHFSTLYKHKVVELHCKVSVSRG